MSGNARELAAQTVQQPHLQQNIRKAVQLTVQEIRRRFSCLLAETGNNEGGAPESVRCLNLVFNHDCWPESARDLQQFGEQEVDFLVSHFDALLRRYHQLSTIECH